MVGGVTAGEPNRRLRVLHVVDSLGAGGMENGVVNVAQRLVGEIDSWVAALRERGVFAERMPEPSQVLAMGKQSGFSWGACRRLRATIKDIRPDIIHTHNLGPLLYVSMARRLGLPGRPFPRIVHGEHSMLEGEELSRRRLFQRSLFYRGCAAVHTVSKGLVKGLEAEGLRAARMEAIINGVDGERFCPDEGKSGGSGGGRLTIGVVGRLVARKRHVMLIEAFESIARDYPNSSLLIVGDQGPELDRIRNAIDVSPVRDRIEWVPFQERPEEFYRKMSLLAVPSESEGLANVVLEAMATGVPVLGSLACGTPEVVTDGRTGFLGAIAGVKDLESLLRRALDEGSEGLASMGESARADVVERFSLSAMSASYLALYRSVLNS